MLKRLKLISLCSMIMLASVLMIFFVSNTTSLSIQTLEKPIMAVLSALLASSFAILLFEVVLKRDAEKDFQRLITETIESSVEENMGISASGLVAFQQELDNTKLAEAINNSRTVKILQTYAPNISSLRQAIVDAKKRRAKIQILLLDPESDFVPLRASETPGLHENIDAMKMGVSSNLSRLKGFIEEQPKGTDIEVRLYAASPGVCIYSTDQRMWVGTYLRNTDAVSSPFIEILSGNWGYETYERHFEQVWVGATPYSL